MREHVVSQMFYDVIYNIKQVVVDVTLLVAQQNYTHIETKFMTWFSTWKLFQFCSEKKKKKEFTSVDIIS